MAFSAALCRGLIEAQYPVMRDSILSWSFPRLYAAASLKHPAVAPVALDLEQFSAALCRGLIEAHLRRGGGDMRRKVFSAALCRGLIEAISSATCASACIMVFRGFMPRPH